MNPDPPEADYRGRDYKTEEDCTDMIIGSLLQTQSN